VNYAPEKNPAVADISIRCTTPEGKPATAVRFYAPDVDGGQRIEFRMEGAEAVFTAPRLHAYGVITVNW
jgi:hypothetical protein